MNDSFISSYVCQVTSIEDQLLLFNLPLEAEQALSVQLNELRVLSSHPLALFAQIQELAVQRLLQVLYVIHYAPEPLVQVALKKVKGLRQVGLYPFVVKLVSPNLLVLKLFHGFAQAVGLPRCVLPFEFRVLDQVMHSAL